jgi:hypothetical protein
MPHPFYMPVLTAARDSTVWLLFVVTVSIGAGRLHGQSIYDQQYGSVVRQSGQYSYVPERQAYLKNHVPDDTEGGYNDFWQGSANFLQHSNEKLSYYNSSQEGGLRAGVGGNIVPGFRGFRRSNIDILNVDPRYFHMQLGPLFLDSFVLGAGALWVDQNGTVPHSNGRDGWAGLAWASARVSLMFSDNFILSLRPTIFYSYPSNRVGWLFNPFTTTMRPNVLAELNYDFNVNAWKFNFYERLGVVLAAGRWFTFPQRQSSSSNILDRVGRYGFGAQGQVDDWSITERFSLSNWQDYIRLYNITSFSGQTNLSDTVTMQTLLSRIDMWNIDLDHIRDRLTGGISINVNGSYIQPFASYVVTTREPYTVYNHQLYVGAKSMLRQDLAASVAVGYLTNTGSTAIRDSWLGVASLQWQMTPFTTHILSGGRQVKNTAYLPLALDDFVQYSLTQQIGFNAQASVILGSIQRAQIDEGRGGGNAHVNYAGLTLQFLLTESLRLSAVSGYENIDQGTNQFQRWTHRLNMDKALSESLALQMFYQYMENSGTFAFTEQVLYMGMTKRF